jgi:hypothetical protein
MFDLPYRVTHLLAGSIYKRHAELMIAAETMTEPQSGDITIRSITRPS